MPRNGMPASITTRGPGQDPAPPLNRQLRAVAALIGRVRRGQSLTEALPQVPAELRPGCQALAFHVLRWRGSALAARVQLAPRAPAPGVDDLLISALALLWPVGPDADAPRYAEHTVVDEAVRCARSIEPRSAGFINAVLRQFLRSREAIVSEVQARDEGRFNHPDWWVRRLRQDWPLQAEGILQAAQSRLDALEQDNPDDGGDPFGLLDDDDDEFVMQDSDQDGACLWTPSVALR